MRAGRWFPRLIVVAALVQFLLSAVRPMISYQAIALGASTLAIGIISSSFATLSLVLAIPVGRMIDHRGERPFLAAGSLVVAAVPLLVLFMNNLTALALCNALLGLGQIMSVVATQTLIAKGDQAEKRESRFGVFVVTNSFGQLLGPAFAGLLVGDATAIADAGSVPNSFRVFAVTAGAGGISFVLAVSLLLAPGSLADRPSVTHRRSAREHGAVRQVLSVPSMPHAMLSSLTALATNDILTAYLPVYGEAHGISVRTVGLLLAASGVAMMAARTVMVPAVRRFGRQRVLVCCLLLPAASVAALTLVTAVPVLFVLMSIIGFGLGLGQPITLNWVASRAPHSIRGTAMSIRLTGNRLGQAVIPAAAGGLAGATNLVAVFLSPAALLTLSGMLVLRSRMDPGEGDGLGA